MRNSESDSRQPLLGGRRNHVVLYVNPPISLFQEKLLGKYGIFQSILSFLTPTGALALCFTLAPFPLEDPHDLQLRDIRDYFRILARPSLPLIEEVDDKSDDEDEGKESEAESDDDLAELLCGSDEDEAKESDEPEDECVGLVHSQVKDSFTRQLALTSYAPVVANLRRLNNPSPWKKLTRCFDKFMTGNPDERHELMSHPLVIICCMFPLSVPFAIVYNYAVMEPLSDSRGVRFFGSTMLGLFTIFLIAICVRKSRFEHGQQRIAFNKERIEQTIHAYEEGNIEGFKDGITTLTTREDRGRHKISPTYIPKIFDQASGIGSGIEVAENYATQLFERIEKEEQLGGSLCA